MKYWYSSNLAKISCWKMQVQIMFFNPSSILSCKNWQHKIAPSKLLYRSVRVANKIRLTSPLFIEVESERSCICVSAFDFDSLVPMRLDNCSCGV